MKEARKRASNEKAFIVTSETQTGGRGTQGRSWEAPPGNLYTTLGVHRELVQKIQTKYLPLVVGTCLIDSIREWIYTEYHHHFHIKWPNDILVKEKKVSGILMESTAAHFLIGIGINVTKAPDLPSQERQATTLVESGMENTELRRQYMARTILEKLLQMLEKPFVTESFLEDWKTQVHWNMPLKMRALDNQICWPIDINSEGQLQVRDEKGQYHWLTSDYLV
jgi:BirA family biotin operon repressor/biotin-[acetyl-CoA-carboxylase] ligase